MWTRKPGGFLKALHISASPGTRLRSRKHGSLNRYVFPVAGPFAGLRSQAYGKPPENETAEKVLLVHNL